MNLKNTCNKEAMKDRRKKKRFAQLKTVATVATVASVVALAVIDILDMEEKTVHVAGEYTDKFAGGDGTKANPYLISTPMHLDQIRYINVEGVYYKVIQNIKLPKESWTPIQNFVGHFDGGFYKIEI